MITCFIVISCINYHYSSRLFSKSKDSEDKNDIKPGIVMSDEVIKGWPPDGNLNISDYIKPDINTTLIEPTLPLRTNISWRSDIYSKMHILICVISAVDSSERRNLIRKTWAKEQTELPVEIIFVIGKNEFEENPRNIHL